MLVLFTGTKWKASPIVMKKENDIYCHLELKINYFKHVPTNKLNISNFLKKTSSYNTGQGLLYKLLTILSRDLFSFPKLGCKWLKEEGSFINSFSNLGLYLIKQTIYHNQVNRMWNEDSSSIVSKIYKNLNTAMCKSD